MKYLTMALILFMALMPVYTYRVERHAFEYQYANLKNTADLAAQAAGLYYDKEAHGEGYIIFDQTEGQAACEAIIKAYLHLNDDFSPMSGSYYRETVQYTLVFIDATTVASFPVIYTDPETGFTETFGSPGVAVIIDGGEPHFSDPQYHGLIQLRRLGSYIYEERR